jgi:hypothetical protein
MPIVTDAFVKLSTKQREEGKIMGYTCKNYMTGAATNRNGGTQEVIRGRNRNRPADVSCLYRHAAAALAALSGYKGRRRYRIGKDDGTSDKLKSSGPFLQRYNRSGRAC